MKSRSMKTLVILCAAIIMIFACRSVDAKVKITYNKTATTVKSYTGASYKMYYDGTLVTDSKHPALMINDNVMIPYYVTLVHRGPKCTAAFKASTKKLTLTLGSQKVKLYLYKKYIKINGVKKTINTAPIAASYNGVACIMVPAKAVCAALDLDYTYVKSEKAIYVSKKIDTSSSTYTSIAASTLTTKKLLGMTTARFISLMGPIAQKDYKRTGVLASVTLAQAINESGWGKSGLAQKSNNMFGMKISLSGNTWAGSVWDGKSYVKVYTREEYKGKKVTITAKFRKYKNIALSVADHSAYLKNAMNGSSKRYRGLTATTSYSKQLKILQKGGYCTWSGYVKELSAIIKKYNLTKYDKK